MKMFRKVYHSIIPEKNRVRIKYLQFSLRGIFYKGSKVFCNCCDKSFSRFLPFGERIKREYAACPSCNSLERTRLIWFYLTKEARIETSALKILHFAPERPIEQKIKKLSNISYISADINPAYADLKVDITNIQFADNSFDLVICSHVLAHVDNETKAMNELYRILKPGGIALILTHIFSQATTFEDPTAITKEQKLKVFQQDDLFRVHGKDFAFNLSKAGFNNVNTIDYSNSFTNEEKIKFGLTLDDPLFIATKD